MDRKADDQKQQLSELHILHAFADEIAANILLDNNHHRRGRGLHHDGDADVLTPIHVLSVLDSMVKR